MKKILLSLIFVSLSNLGNSQILSQDFQGLTFPPTGWTTATNVPTRPWALTTSYNVATQDVYNITGGSSAMIAWIAQDQDAHLTSPSFSLVGYTNATFTFNAKIGYEFMVAPNANGDLKVNISTDGGTIWSQLWQEEDYGVFVDYATLAISLDLTAFVGQPNVKIQFQYVANDADTLSIDDILIQGTLSSDSFSLNGVKMYPNPATNVLNIQSGTETLTKVSITDLNGRVVKEVSNNLSQISLGNLAKGIYMVTIESATAKKVEKLIVE
jgi:hypothetical protein